DNPANADSSFTFVVYGSGGTTIGTPLVVTLSAHNALTACPAWLQLIITASNQFILTLGASQGATSWGPVTFTDSTYTTGLMGLSDYGCPNSYFEHFQWT